RPLGGEYSASRRCACRSPSLPAWRALRSAVSLGRSDDSARSQFHTHDRHRRLRRAGGGRRRRFLRGAASLRRHDPAVWRRMPVRESRRADSPQAGRRPPERPRSNRGARGTARRAPTRRGPLTMLFRYSRWAGTQRADFDADDLLDAMADDVLYDGDPRRALRRLMQQGMKMPEGGKLPGLRDLLERLKRQRQQRLDRYDLGSSLEDIKKK